MNLYVFVKGFNWPLTYRWLLMMKLAVLLTLVAVLQATAGSFAQHITLEAQNIPLSQAMQSVQKQSGYLFLFKGKDLANTKVSVKVRDADLKKAMDELLKGKAMDWMLKDNTIIIRSIATVPQMVSVQETIIQELIISGKVTDGSGVPIEGVTVAVKGTMAAVTTDSEGNYLITVPRDGTTLVFTSVGYHVQETPIGSSNVINIVMKESISDLDEVVIVGYGTQKKSNVTGSVSSIRVGDFEDLNMGVTSVIQGRVAGVNVSNGNIIIRGAASVNGADPLWIVDGVPGSVPNFNDIESIEILKDAASTAIYGARGAGGVILVTTKKGTPGKISINFRSNIGTALPIDLPQLLETPDFIDRKIAAGFANNPASGWDNPSSLPNTNWEDYVWRNALHQNHFLQVTGGNDKTTFNTSAEFYRNEQVEQRAFDSGGNIRIASQTNLNKRMKITEIISLGFTNNSPRVFGYEEAGRTYYRQVPTMVPYDNENSAGGGWGRQPPGGYYEGPNPAATIESRHFNNKSYWGRANLMFDYEVIDHLKFQANFSGNFNSFGNNEFQEYWNTGNITQEERYTKDYGISHNMRMLYTLTYDRTFAEKHDVKGMVGYEANRAESSGAGGWRTGFSVQPVEDMSLGTGSTEATGGKGLGRSLSQFARVNYAYDSKYLLEASIRRDGYDTFGPENRFGVFPSASAGWNIARESFISENENLNWLTQLKLRASIGKIGNNTIAQFLYEPAYTNNYLYYSWDDQTTDRGFWYSNIANAAIKWEDVTQWNVGMDASFLNNRLNTTIEYYNKKTSDMLYSVGAPPSSGSYTTDIFATAPFYMANIGEISNKGFEFMAQWRDSHHDFSYDVAFTLSTNNNRVIKLSDQVNPIMWAGSSTALNSSVYRTENGFPMGQVYGYVVDGIFQNEQEINALNNSAPDGLYQQSGTAPGDFRYRDLDGDGQITIADRTFVGNPWPEVIYGLNVSLSWNGFDLTMGWLANTGMDIFNSAKIYERSFYGDFNTTYKVYEAWSPTNTNTNHPRVTNNDPNNNFRNVSSYFVEDGSFLKLKNLHFGYNLPHSFLSRYNIQGLKFFINCDNILIITEFQGDPELGGGYLSRNNYTEKRFPQTRSIVGGISLTL